MLKFTRRAEYGLMALAFLASRPGSHCSVREIVASLGVPRRLLAEVLKSLAHAGLVDAARGPGGGYRLLAQPDQIPLAVVVSALEGPLKVTDCQNGGSCDLGASCIIRRGLGAVANRIELVLENFTLSDLLHTERTKSACPEPAQSK